MAYEQEFDNLERELLDVLEQWGGDSETLKLWRDIRNDARREFEINCRWNMLLSILQYFPGTFSDAVVAVQQQRDIKFIHNGGPGANPQSILRLNNATRQISNLKLV
jgi:hypothetical protein